MLPIVKVLIIEDDQGSREALLILLNQNGWSIKGCSSGREAIDLLAAEPFDVLVCDLLLPDRSRCPQGYEHEGHCGELPAAPEQRPVPRPASGP